MKTPRNRAAQDVNLINLRALKKRVRRLEVAFTVFTRLYVRPQRAITQLQKAQK